MSTGKLIRVLFAAIITVTLGIIVACSIWSVVLSPPLSTGETLRAVSLDEAVARVDGGDWVPLSQASFDVGSHHHVEVRGHLSDAIAAGERLNLRLNNVDCRVLVNGALVYSFGGTPTVLSRSAGNTWDGFVASTPITTADEVQIEIENVYVGGVSSVFNTVLDKMAVGTEGALAARQLSENWFHLVFGIISIGVGTFLFATALLAVRLGWDFDEGSVWFSLFAISAGFWSLFDPNYIDLFVRLPLFTNYVCSQSSFTMVLLLSAFVAARLHGRSHDILGSCCVAIAAMFLVGTVLQLTGGPTGPDFDDFTQAGLVAGYVLLAGSSFLLVRDCLVRGDSSLRSTLLLYVPCAIGVALEYLVFLLGNAASGYFIEFGVTTTILLRLPEMVSRQRKRQEAASRLHEVEAELRDSQTRIMLSQIQPHFLYNALNTIQYLCRTDPETAADAVGDFAAYLRGNMDSLKQTQPLPLTVVLDHLEHYLAIERLRFPDVRIVYDLDDIDFSIPSLSLQPLVENAIKHGLGKEPDGGTVTISSWKDDVGHHLSVVDDGVGFDPAAPLDPSRSHVGIENTRGRLRDMCGGTLSVESHPGKGTKVVITIPFEEVGHA